MDDVGTFDRLAPLFDLVNQRANAAALRTGLVHAEREVRRVVDLGGGTGRGVRAVEAPERIVVDAARGMVRRARANGHTAIRGDAGRIPLRDGSVDAVLVVDALHHFPDRTTTLEEIARILALDGVVVIADFDPTTVRGRVLVAAERLLGFDSRFDAPDGLADRLDAAGLTPIVVDEGFGYVLAGRR